MATGITNRNTLRKAAAHAWCSLTRVISTAAYPKQLRVDRKHQSWTRYNSETTVASGS
jgi:hypothetical protein